MSVLSTRDVILSLILIAVPSSVCGQVGSSTSAPSRPIGFRVERLADPSRPFQATPGSRLEARPIQAYLWYPAADACDTPLTWGDVVEWVGVEGRHDPLDAVRAQAGRNEFVTWVASMEGDTTAARSALGVPLRACEDARAERGSHPIVLLAVGRNDSPVMHALLGEELASLGWVVLATGGIGARQHAMEFGVADIEAQVADLGALAEHARSLDFADPSRLSVVGYSFGGGVAILYAMADTTVSAVVSLDGSIGFADRVPAYLAMAEWHPDRMRAPVLHLRAPAEERKDLSALEALTVPVRIETVPGAVHLDFTIMGPLSANGLSIPALGLDDTDGDELYAMILRATVAFLEEHRPSGID